MDNRPIGMFDSGIGGLTVLREYQKLMPNEKYIYYADTKHLPYGNKTKEEIISYAENIVEFFLSKDVKAIVIACGTASSLAYEHLKEKYNVPIFDIITPVAQKIHAHKIGVLATQSSIQSGVWEKRIQKENPECIVFSQACPMLVPLAEAGKINSFSAKHYIKQYTKNFRYQGIDSLILGCTHYPLFSKSIQKSIGNTVSLVNIGTLSAQSFHEYMLQNNLATNSTQGNITYFTSGNEIEFTNKVNTFWNIYQK